MTNGMERLADESRSLPEPQFRRLLLDISTSFFWTGQPTGILRVEKAIAARASAYAQLPFVYVVWDSEGRRFLTLDDNVARAALEGSLELRLGRNGLRLRDYALEATTVGAHDLLVSTGMDWENPGRLRDIYRLRRATGLGHISVVYDLGVWRHPHLTPPAYRDRLKEHLGEQMHVSDKLLCTSEAVRGEIDAYRDTLGLPEIQTGLFHLGAGFTTTQAAAALAPELHDMSYVMFVSTVEARKNHRTLYQAWDQALSRGLLDRRTARLVFVGRLGWGIDDLVAEISSNPRTRDTILFIPDADDRTLDRLYTEARACFFPSLYEGFGLPVAEALARGKPVFASTDPAVVEAARGKAIHLDPLDIASWGAALVRAVNDDAWLRAETARLCQGLPLPDWDDAAKRLYAELSLR